MNLPKHIQEAATPLTDSHINTNNTVCGHAIVCHDHARNLERLTIWQQEVIEKLQAMAEYVYGYAESSTSLTCNCCDRSPQREHKDTCHIGIALEQYTQLQSCLKTLKGEKE